MSEPVSNAGMTPAGPKQWQESCVKTTDLVDGENPRVKERPRESGLSQGRRGGAVTQDRGTFYPFCRPRGMPAYCMHLCVIKWELDAPAIHSHGDRRQQADASRQQRCWPPTNSPVGVFDELHSCIQNSTFASRRHACAYSHKRHLRGLLTADSRVGQMYCNLPLLVAQQQ
eukprot:GHUV01042763.1.p1 GENE.GHUV01042763.1~~GHUV01042763.1.p1  ORF type:complete len:171 (+),score=10.06 GHUV01042763.1:245-757(+)